MTERSPGNERHGCANVAAPPRWRSPGDHRRGILSTIVILVIVVLSIFMVQFHTMSRQGQATTFGMEQREVAHQMVEISMEEAFTRLLRDTLDGRSKASEWLRGKDPKPFPLTVPFSEKKIKELARSNQDPVLEAVAQIIQSDFRRTDSKGNKYYGLEGVGTVRLSTRIWLDSASKSAGRPAYCELVRMHDYKVVSTRTRRDNGSGRTEYAHSFALDYALLIRKGFEEFANQSAGQCLNNDRVRLVIDQRGIPPEDQGKILIGGTDKGAGKFVFLNVHEKFGKEGGEGLIPKPTKADDVIDYEECMELFPKIKAEIDKYGSEAEALMRQATKGIFKIRHLPIIRDSYSGPDQQTEKEIIDLVAAKETGAGANILKGMELLGPDLTILSSANPDRVFEGDVRQRFFKRVDFHIELQGDQIPKEYADKIKKDTSLTAAEGLADGGAGTGQQDQETKQQFVDGLRKVCAAHGFDYFSRLIASYPYRTGLSGDPQPGFPKFQFPNLAGTQVDLETTGPTGVQPFFHVNLWGKRMEENEHLEQVGIIDNEKGVLFLNGFSCVEKSVVIGEVGKTLKVRGQGGIISKENITINATLVKDTPDDFCVFFTRNGSIVVNAPQVDASLIALGNKDGQVFLRQPTTIKGAVVVEFLKPSTWVDGTHTITYDPVLKSRNADLYVVNLGPCISYQRIVEGQQ